LAVWSGHDGDDSQPGSAAGRARQETEEDGELLPQCTRGEVSSRQGQVRRIIFLEIYVQYVKQNQQRQEFIDTKVMFLRMQA
jgi:hypothetical protein